MLNVLAKATIEATRGQTDAISQWHDLLLHGSTRVNVNGNVPWIILFVVQFFVVKVLIYFPE